MVDLSLPDPSPGTHGADCNISENTAHENNELKFKINRSRQRKRTESKAIDHLDCNLTLPPIKRLRAISQIRNAKQPLREAKHIIKWHSIRSLSLKAENPDSCVDQAAIKMVITKLIDRDGSIWNPQAAMVTKLQASINKGMKKTDFEEAAAIILGMEQVLPKPFLDAERSWNYGSG